MKPIFLLFVLSIYSSSILFAQVNQNEELKELIQKSYSYFPKIAEAENMISSAEEKKKITELNNKPGFSANANYQILLPKIAFPINGNEVQFVPVHNLGTSLNASWTIIDFGRFKASIDKEKTSIQLSKDQVEVAKSQLKTQVASIYYLSLIHI